MKTTETIKQCDYQNKAGLVCHKRKETESYHLLYQIIRQGETGELEVETIRDVALEQCPRHSTTLVRAIDRSSGKPKD